MPTVNSGFTIAVIASGIDEEYQQSILKGIHRYAAQHHVNVAHFIAFGGILANLKYDQGEYNIFELPNFDLFDGVILLSNTFSGDLAVKLAQRIQSAGIPTVSIDRELPGYYNIGVQNAPAMEAIVRHLIVEHGVRRLNFISGPDTNTENIVRYDAFVRVLKEYDIPLEPERIYHGTFRAKDGRNAVRAFVQSELEFPEAIVCANDAMAIAAVVALEEYGIRCPEDVLVTGFDNIYNARHMAPTLTTVERPLMQSGALACELLCHHAAGDDLKSYHEVSAVPIYAESCGCHCDETEDISLFKKIVFQGQDSVERDISRQAQMACSLVECDSLSEYLEALKKFVEKTNCEEFYLCLNDSWHTKQVQKNDIYGGEAPEDTYIVEGYSQRMLMPLAYYDKRFHNEPGFISAEILPRLRVDGSTTRNIFFAPLHFRERCLGYYAIVNSDFPMQSKLFHTFSINISNTLENFRKLLCLNEMVQELDKLYAVDALTGVFNRNGFKRTTQEPYAACVENQTPVMVMFADMDGLKTINDTLGHKEGDHAIRSVSSILQQSCLGDEIVCRFGGDEFLVFGAGYTNEDLERLRLRIQHNLDIANRYGGRSYPLSISIGACISVPEENSNVFHLITIADNRMYEEKRKKNPSKYLKQPMKAE